MGGQVGLREDCPACRGKNFNFRRAFSACIYEEPIKELIHLFKYKSKLKLRKLFAAILIRFIRDYSLPIRDYDLFVSIPMHPARLREREFNHSQILAEELSFEFKIPVNSDNIIRSRHGAPQAALSEKERMKNVKEAFRIKRPEGFLNKNILIIDDVFTTGSTVSEIALLLNENKAGAVDVLTLARSTQDKPKNESN
jgi:ComF family protein